MDFTISIIGGGSRGWALTLFRDLAITDGLKGKIRLYDIDHPAAEQNKIFGNKIFSHETACSHFEITVSKTVEDALDGADFIVFSIEPGPIEMRYADLVLPEKYSILQTVGDTTGPGGLLRAWRAVPLFTDYAHRIMKYCPDSWSINYTNPMTLCTWALYKAEPQIKAIGCCHEVFLTQNFLARNAADWFKTEKPERQEIKLDICGVNHFTFATKASWNGKDLFPLLGEMADNPDTFKDLSKTAAERIKQEKWFDSNHLIALDFLNNYGELGSAGDRHLAEFVPWYLSDEKNLHKFGIPRTPYKWRVRNDINKKKRKYTDSELVPEKSDEEGVDIIKALLGIKQLTTNVNFPNSGQIDWLPKGHIVETYADFSKDNVKPVKSTVPGSGLKSLISGIVSIQEIAMESILQKDRDLLFQAFLNDPLVNIPTEKARELFIKMLAYIELQE